MSLDIHPDHGNLFAVGFYDGKQLNILMQLKVFGLKLNMGFSAVYLNWKVNSTKWFKHTKKLCHKKSNHVKML